MTNHRLLGLFFSTFLALPLSGAESLKETEFTASDAIRLLNAQGWSFSYSPAKPVRRLDMLIYEERTDQAGRTETTVRHSCMLGVLAKERDFPIKLLLVGNELHAMMDAARSVIKVSEDFVPGDAEYRKTGDCKEDKNGRRFLIEVGNKNPFKGKAAFRSELKFKIFENLDQAALKLLLDGGGISETAKAGAGSADETDATSRKMQSEALERELQQSTDMVIVSPHPAGGYRVVSVIKGSRFSATDSPISAESLNIAKDIQSEHREAGQLLVWQSEGDQDFFVPLKGIRPCGALPVSPLGDVTLNSGLKVSLMSMRLKPLLIHVTSGGEQAAPSKGDKPSN